MFFKIEMIMLRLILFLLLFLQISIAFANPKLDKARKLYLGAVKDEDKLDESILLFEELKTEIPNIQGKATTYLGSLTMLKGKHAFWPHKKVEYVNDGIKIMDQGLKQDPNNLESLFIYGSSCFYLPFFLGKSDLADQKFKKFIEIINEDEMKKYEQDIMNNALKFLIEKFELTEDEKTKLNNLLSTF